MRFIIRSSSDSLQVKNKVYSQYKLILFSYNPPLLMQKARADTDKPKHVKLQPLDIGQPYDMDMKDKRKRATEQDNAVLIVGNFVTYSN